MKIVSLFSGCGGLDLGFKQNNFKTIWANEFDHSIAPTFEANFNLKLNTNSITEVNTDDVPDCDGIIGGPPCQSWSIAGKQKGANDPRGRLFDDFIRFVSEKKPKFFLAENVAGFLMQKYNPDFYLDQFAALGYNVSCIQLNSKFFEVPQDRKRVFIIGYASSFGEHFKIQKIYPEKNLQQVIGHLKKGAVKALKTNKHNPRTVNNHEYMTGKFSSHYMSRNRVRSWNEPSFTIQASGRHAPCHPKAPKFQPVSEDVMRFVPGKEKLYRRLTVRECAEIQTFPSDFEFIYHNLADGYKMIGNAVPVRMAFHIAKQIKKDFKRFSNLPVDFKAPGTVKKGQLIANQTLQYGGQDLFSDPKAFKNTSQ